MEIVNWWNLSIYEGWQIVVLVWLRVISIGWESKKIVKLWSFSPYAGCNLLELYSWWNLSKYGCIKVCNVLVYENCQIMKPRKLLNVSFKYFIRFLIFQFYGVC